MRLEWIRCFDEVARSGSITKAAQKLYITQPAVTKIIHSLETEFHETFFIRSTTGVQLTEQGQIFARFAKQVLKDYAQYLSEKSAYQALPSAYKGSISLAIAPLLLQTYYQAILEHIHKRFPQVNIHFIEANVDTTIKLIEQNPHTLGIILFTHTIFNNSSANLCMQELGTSHLVICTAKSSSYAAWQAILPDTIPPENLISIGFYPTHFSQLSPDSYNTYTSNLAIIRQQLLTAEDACVLIPQIIAAKHFAQSDIVQLTPHEPLFSSIGFIYSELALEQQFYSDVFLQILAHEIKKAIFT